MQDQLHSVPIETNLLRKGLIRVGRGSKPVDARDLLGTVKASAPLALTDLDVLGWISARLSRGESAVAFSREELAVDLFGRRPGGRERTLVRESLERLATVRLTLGGYDASRKVTDLDGAFVDVPILRNLERLESSGYASPTWRVELADWLLEQLAHGCATYADWATLRTLMGLQKRLWLYFEAEPESPFWVSLGHRGLTSLGVGSTSTSVARRRIFAAVRGLHDAPGSYRARLRSTRVGDRLIVYRRSPELTATLFDDDERPARRGWVRVEGSTRRVRQTFDPDASLIGSKVPVVGGGGRNRKEGMVRRARTSAAHILLEGELPRDQIELLLWMREEGQGLDQILIGVDGTLEGVHNPSCSDLDAALEDNDLEGMFVAADDPKALEKWCERHSVRRPRWCLTCRARFHDRADAPWPN